MGAQPPSQVGQVSPDGMWRWDGSQWVPTGYAGPPPAPARSRAWVWWVVGVCAVLLVLGVAGGVYGVISIAQRFQQGGLTCLPPDFPHYPGSFVSSETTSVGSAHQCRMTFESSDRVTTVEPYFESHLNSGGWTVISADPTTGTITFSRVLQPQVHGTLKASPSSRGTHIEVVAMG